MLLAVLAGIVLSLSSAGAETATLPAAKDNTLYEFVDGSRSNGAGPVMIAGQTNQGSVRRAVLAFDVAGGLPDEPLIINSVELRLQVTNVPPQSAPTDMSLHRLSGDWGEGTSATTGNQHGNGAASTAGDATWIHRFFPDSLWSGPGGDFEAGASAAALVDGLGSYSWTGDGLRDDVELWLTDPGENFGWILIGDESALQTARGFATRENDNEPFRPVLVIDFSRVSPVEKTTWGRIKAAQR
jgi:hypothetical protein